jgi:cytochrome b561
MSGNHDKYTNVGITLHWIIALGVLGQIALGWWMIEIPKHPVGARAYWFNIHKSIGITLGVLIIIRIVWALTHRAPPLPAHIPAWQRMASRANHILLYACMIIMPLSGYLGSSFTKFPIKYWGYTLPNWGWEAPAYKDICSNVHQIAVIIFMVLIGLHVLAALKHMIAGDGVARRMWFR